jgi:geranylgeranyl diphosphate synthase, type I
MAVLSAYFDRLLPIIEADLQHLLEIPAGYPPLFYQMLHYHMGWVDEHGNSIPANGGKRIRPMLSLIVSEAVSGQVDPARPAAAAAELIHNFSLFHDDIQDGSPLRRNRPTAWKIWGTEQGINAGDTMFALAHLAIPRLGAHHPADIRAELLHILDETCLELTRGQHLDMSFEKRDIVSVDEYLDMIEGKTAALLAASAEMAALSAGSDESTRQHYREFGMNLGLAFQVRDDILDIWGDPKLTGKIAAVDIRDRKKSLPALYGLSQSPELQVMYADTLPMDDDRVKTAISLLDAVDAQGYAASLVEEYSHNTIAYLEAADPEGQSGEALVEIVDFLLKRTH